MIFLNLFYKIDHFIYLRWFFLLDIRCEIVIYQQLATNNQQPIANYPPTLAAKGTLISFLAELITILLLTFPTDGSTDNLFFKNN